MTDAPTLTRTVPSYPLRTMEWYAAVVLTLWGLVLLQPSPLFERETFRTFAPIVDEHALGFLLLVVGSIRCAALYVNGHWRRTPLFRAAGAMVGSAVFAGLTALFVISDLAYFARAGGAGGTISGFFSNYQFSTAIAVYAPLTVFESLSAFRCGKDIIRVGRR